VEKIKNDLLPELHKIYVKCKAKSYLENIDEKSVLTILRQILRVHGYSLLSRSKCSKRDRFLEYRIIQVE